MKNKEVTAGIILFALLMLGGVFLQSSNMHLLMKIVIMGLFACSLNIQTGMGGLRPLGHALMFGLGAYFYAFATVKWGMGSYIGIAVSLLLVMAVALILGFLLVRRSDDLAFSFLSMGFCTLVYTSFLKLQYVGFDKGISNVPRLPFITGDRGMYYFVVIVAAVLLALIYLLSKSPFAWIFKACRENKQKAECIGVNIVRVQLAGYMLSGLFASMAGILYAMKNNGAYTSYIAVQLSMEGLIMCLLGGMENFWGPMLGAAVVVLFNTQVTNHTIYSNFWLGVLTLIVVLFMHGGLLDNDTLEKITGIFKKKPLHKTGERG